MSYDKRNGCQHHAKKITPNQLSTYKLASVNNIHQCLILVQIITIQCLQVKEGWGGGNLFQKILRNISEHKVNALQGSYVLSLVLFMECCLLLTKLSDQLSLTVALYLYTKKPNVQAGFLNAHGY